MYYLQNKIICKIAVHQTWNVIFEECRNPIKVQAQKSHPSSDQNNRRARETKLLHRQSMSSRFSTPEACRRSQGALHFVIPFHVLGRMQIPRSMTARDRPRSGFKFKFPTARIPAPVTGRLTFPRRSLRSIHLSPFSGDAVRIPVFFQEKEREKNDTGRSTITARERRDDDLYRKCCHREIWNRRLGHGSQLSTMSYRWTHT